MDNSASQDNTQNPAGGTPPPPPPPGGIPPTPPPAGGMVTPPTGGTPPPPPPAGGMVNPPTGGTPPSPPPEDTTPANFQLGKLFTEGIKLQVPAHPETKFDDSHFISLLAGSISLSKAEKKRIIDAIPKLKQWQIDELVNIFEEEKKKFAQLSQKHVPQLEKLAKQHFEEWQDLEMMQQQEGKKEEDAAKADEIKKKLGL